MLTPYSSQDPLPAVPNGPAPMDRVEGPTSPSAWQLRTELVEHLTPPSANSPAADAKTPAPDDANVVPMEGLNTTAPITAHGVAEPSENEMMDIEISNASRFPPPATNHAPLTEQTAAVPRPTQNHHQPSGKLNRIL